MNLDTAKAAGQLTLKVVATVTGCRRLMMLERQHDGIEMIRNAGKYPRRRPTARSSAYRILDDAKVSASKAQAQC